MNAAAALSALEAIGGRVATAAAVATVLIVIVALAVRLLPPLSPRVAAALWWLVAARILLELAGAPAVELAWLPASTPAPRIVRLDLVAGAVPPDAAAAAEPAASDPVVPARPSLVLLGGLWALSALVVACGASRAWIRSRRRLASVGPETDPRLMPLLEELRVALGLRRPVRVVRAAGETPPHVVGWLRPVIVLPPGEALTDEELRLTLAHELLHVRRRDALRGLVPWLSARLLAFHPLVRWAEREYVLANEGACDAETIARVGASPAGYGRLLLRFATGPSPSHAPATAWALARRPIERRLAMLARPDPSRRTTRAALAAAALLAGLAAWPLRLVGAVAADTPTPVNEPGRADEPTPPAEDSEAAPSGTPVAAEATPIPPRAEGSDPEAARRRRAVPVPPVPPAPALAPVAPLAPHVAVTPRPPIAPTVHPVAWSAPTPLAIGVLPTPPSPPTAPTPPYAVTPVTPLPPAPVTLAPAPPVPPVPPVPAAWSGLSFVLIDGDTRVMVNAEEEDLALAERERRGGEPVLVVRGGARSRVVRDRATIDELVGLLDEQARLAEELARAGAEGARRFAELAERSARELEAQISEQQRQIVAQQEALQRRQAEAVEARSRELERHRLELDRVQRERLREAERELRELERRLRRQLGEPTDAGDREP